MMKWLQDAVFYEIYPQSFYDANGDGIGDLIGIIEKLDYIKELGCNALWINPFYDSPFKDAGYDVGDYKKVAARYGTDEDAVRLFEEAHKRGIKVLIDLVPGHTSEEHEWFKESSKAEKNEYSDRYIWSDFIFNGIEGHPYIGGEAERDGVYMLNFFKCQPALNYGWLTPTEPWQKGIDDPACLATRKAMADVMRFWLEKGCDGFRVDMADSLVKEDDANKSGTCRIYRDILPGLWHDFPQAAFVSEWNNPDQAINGAGFDMDFYLNHPGNGVNSLFRDYITEGEDRSFFRADGHGDIMKFLEEYQPRYNKTMMSGYISLITCNHDTPRLTKTLTKREIELAYAFIFTMPGVPFLYYGDEIGMKYREDLPTKEGGYFRTGSRTPMQWNSGKNLGFSEADAADLYLPVDDAPDAPNVEDAMKDPDSLYHTVKDLIALRHAHKDLQANTYCEVIYAEKEKFPFIYKRGSFIMVLNPSRETMTNIIPAGFEKVYGIGDIEALPVDESDVLKVGPQSFAVFKATTEKAREAAIAWKQ